MVFLRTRLGRRLATDEQGAVAVLTALLMVVLILCAAVVVDLGNARDVRRQSQNAADASSLAGANVLYPTGNCVLDVAKPCIKDAEAAARSYALKNFQVSAGDWTTCTVPAGSAPGMVASVGTACILFDSATSPTLLRVYLPTRPVPTFFAKIIGRSSIPVGSSAQAQLGTEVKCSLCILGSVDAGNGDFTVSGGAIAVNGNVSVGPNSLWNSTSNGIHGTVTGDASDFHPSYTSIPSFSDPLAGLTFPSTTGLVARTDPCSLPPTGGPGLYGAVNLPNATCTLQPGLYVISGKWLAGNKTLVAAAGGVTLWATSPSGELDFKNGDAIFSAPTALEAATTGGLAGYAILYDTDNTHNLGLQGNGSTLITGAVYAKASTLDGNGNSCFGFSGGLIVVNGVYSNGNPGCLQISHAVDATVSRALLHLNQ